MCPQDKVSHQVSSRVMEECGLYKRVKDMALGLVASTALTLIYSLEFFFFNHGNKTSADPYMVFYD